MIIMNNDLLEKTMNSIGKNFRKKPVIVRAFRTKTEFIIHTLEGNHKANIGDWIIQGIKGEFYPCKPDIFEKTYGEVK